MIENRRQTLGDLVDGPPTADEGEVLEVYETEPSPSCIRSASRECLGCSEDIPIGREDYVEARVKLTGGVAKSFKKLQFCDWPCWHEWASR